MTELSFLIDLLLNHKLSPKTKEHVANRIREVEERLSAGILRTNFAQIAETVKKVGEPHISLPSQAPSTLASFAKHGLIPEGSVTVLETPPPPVAVIAQTPATAAAMQARQESIATAMSGKLEKGATKPRKW